MLQLQVNRDIEKLNAQNINNINELGDLNVGNAEAKQQSFEEQAIHDQKGLSKIIGCKKGKRGIRENHKDPTNVNSASKLSKQTKEKVRKATQRRRKGRSIVFHTEIITNQVLTSKILNSCFL